MPVSPDSLQLFGTFQLLHGGQPVTLGQQRLEELLALLAIHPGAPMSRAHIAYQFWPDSSEKQARTNLRKTLLMLRRRLPDADAYLQVDRQHVQWRADAPCSVDVVRFRAALAAAQSDEAPSSIRQQLALAVELYGGELLPGCYDDWVLSIRERLHQAYMGALVQLVDLLEQGRDYAAAAHYAQRAISQDPLHEGGYLRLMRLHALQGDRARALRVYHACATVLLRELGVEPNDEIQAAYAQFLMLDEPAAAERSAVSCHALDRPAI